jgi:hypothetical protein
MLSSNINNGPFDSVWKIHWIMEMKEPAQTHRMDDETVITQHADDIKATSKLSAEKPQPTGTTIKIDFLDKQGKAIEV